MSNSGSEPSRAGITKSEVTVAHSSGIEGFDGCEPPLCGGTVAEALDIVAGDVADCVPVKVAVLDSHFKIRALNAEWRRMGAFGSDPLGQGFVETCLATASSADRNTVLSQLRRLDPSKPDGLMTTVRLELGGLRWSFALRARRLSKAPAFVVVALLDAVIERSTIARIVLDAEEAERRRIARELHDETAQRLAAMQLGLAGLRECGSGMKFDRRCCDIEAMLRSVQDELRTLSYTLHPPEIDDAGLVEALGRFVSGFARRTRLKATFVSETCGSRTDCVTDRALYRVTQEALTNVGKHAEATNAMVSLRECDHRLVLEVEDDGIGITPELCYSRSHARLGVGLSAMRERIEALAGKFEVSRLSTGTRVRAILPVRDYSRNARFRAL